MLWLDEFAFLQNNSVTYKAAKPALTKATEAAEAVGQPFGISITTTPKKLGVILVIIWKISFLIAEKSLFQ